MIPRITECVTAFSEKNQESSFSCLWRNRCKERDSRVVFLETDLPVESGRAGLAPGCPGCGPPITGREEERSTGFSGPVGVGAPP